jgi:hypothetical protein
MTLRDFLQNNTLSAVELVNHDGNQIINVYIGEVCYGLDIDTSNIPSGTQLEYRTDVTLQDDILLVADLSIDTNTVKMLAQL